MQGKLKLNGIGNLENSTMKKNKAKFCAMQCMARTGERCAGAGAEFQLLWKLVRGGGSDDQ
jgi:hypothetical protein